ncbi:hypothetical protein AM588_10007878 [Phytophthora nicotianae]|uniref:LIM zinc-binding domain-containing protein n=1 Tax=Phytophthora nicotianae TaxID=4792 RepID=A0A0W8D5G0_PHYNI|nr:hypothetical protein AM588_10007878 [Phytophthora nicotianae]
MGWTCVQCTFLNANDSAANCGACNAIRVLQCPTCKGEIKMGGGKPVQNGKYNSPVQKENCSKNANVKSNGNAKSNGNGGGWNCPSCTYFNTNDAAPTCAACDAIRIMKCPGCKGEIKFGQRVNVDGKAYHPDCFRCAACNGKFTTSKFQVKDGEYYHHECYKQLYHPRCQRVEAQGVVKEVWTYMRDIGIHLPEIPVYLVESPVLNEQCNAHKKTKTLMKGNKPVEGHVTRGLCLSEVSQIQHMVRSGKHAVPRVASIEKVDLFERDPDSAWTTYDLTASVLAHEATHAYIKLSDNFPDHIPPKGRLRKFYMHQLKNDISPVYGDGFREAYEAYKRVNSLQRMFDAIRHHASFP